MAVFKKKEKFALHQLQQQNLTNDNNNKIGQWFAKWDRTIAAITAVIVFFGLFTWVIIHIPYDDNNNGGLQFSLTLGFYNQSVGVSKMSLKASPPICTREGSDGLYCSDMEVESLPDAINEAAKRYSQNQVVELQLEFIYLADNKIESGWLDGVDIQFNTLTIKTTSLSELGERVFAGGAFSYLKKLNLFDTNLNILRKGTFLDTKLEIITINFSNFHQINIEIDTFKPISHTLQILQLGGCIDNTETLENITGSRASKLTALRQLDLQFNKLGKLKSTNFVNVPHLTSLFVNNAELTELEEKIFRNQRLTLLTINDNRLKTLPQDIFSTLTPNARIFINRNPWKCNCDLLWFRDFYSRHNYLFSDGFYCNWPWDSILYTKFDFCPNGNTAMMMQTAIPTSVNVKFGKNSSKKILTVTDSDQVSLHQQAITIIFSQQGDESFYVLEFLEDVGNYKVWYGDDSGYVGYARNVRPRFYETTLNYDKTYTFCLENQNTEVFPLDCVGLKVPPSWENCTWIWNKYKIIAISVICVSSLAIILISALFAFYWIRQHPNLIKGNKRVIMVESNAADAIVLPKTYDQLSYEPPSLRSVSNGYLTPRNKVYNARLNGTTLRTISENTVYPVPVASSPSEHRIRKNYRRRVKMEHYAKPFDEQEYEAPPLPPNHPSGWRCSIALDDYSRA